MSNCQKIIITLLIIILVSILGYFIWIMWNKENEAEEVIIFENYRDKVKLDCNLLIDKLTLALCERINYLREYIIISLNNHSYDERYFLYIRLMKNGREIAEIFKYILGDKVGAELNNLLVENINNWKDYLNNFTVEQKEDDEVFLRKINANSTNISDFLAKNLFVKGEMEENRFNIFSDEMRDMFRLQKETILEELQNYYHSQWPISIELHDKNLRHTVEMAKNISKLLCQKSKENKRKKE